MTTTTPTIRRFLQTLHPIAGFGPAELDELAHKTEIESLHPGRRLFLRGHRDPWTFYLLDGKLLLEWSDGRSETVSGGEPAACRPLNDAQPRTATATAVGRVQFIRFDTTLLDVLSRAVGPDSYALEEIGADADEPRQRLFYAIFRDYLADALTLPHLPDVALRVREAVQQPECDAAEVARLIQADPVLAARMVQVANSPLYGVQTPIYSCKAAVMFLGLNTTRDLVVTYTLHELFRTDSALLRQRMHALWQHSVLVGAVSYVLAGMTPGLDKDRALLAGLLHDIGALPVIDYAARVPELGADGALLDEAIRALRAQVGAMVLRQWKFGGEMVNVALEAEDWQRDPVQQAEYGDAVVIAQQLLAADADPERLVAIAQLPAWRKLARGRLDGELVGEVLREARTDVADVLQLLG
ncbi:MAG: hypothetical protein CVV05_06225 [Gammaproteobacteria bacterium HGW-Gammaproteobacteria-1]|jgi:HD-like signal output (HDOD) protein|nr:MAG: hypothetical protein CVV05_06225 [Gammaproteobacteria bacterium HGW-Gammaproteobacteria-1]